MWFTMQFNSKNQLHKCIDLLQDRYGVTGELTAKPMKEEGHWELHVVSEKNLSSDLFEELPGRRVEASP